MTPLRIGILGAARIAAEGIVEPAAEGHRLVAVAAAHRPRAEQFAARYGVERVLDDYQAVLDDPEVDLVYVPLINSLHTRWNLAALAAGKHVLSEKPMAANSAEAAAVADAAARSTGSIVEGFHYLHHPSVRRIEELVRSGALGEITAVDIVLETERPPADDPRWSYELAGGSLMDLGCYVLHAHRQLARWAGAGEPRVTSATAVMRAGAPDVDEAMTVELDYLPGAVTTASWNMDATTRRMVWTVTGTRGSVTHPAFAVPHLDNRLQVDLDGHSSVETLGDTTSYVYQLRRYALASAGKEPFPLDVADALASAQLIDAVFREAGVALRGRNV